MEKRQIVGHGVEDRLFRGNLFIEAQEQSSLRGIFKVEVTEPDELHERPPSLGFSGSVMVPFHGYAVTVTFFGRAGSFPRNSKSVTQ